MDLYAGRPRTVGRFEFTGQTGPPKGLEMRLLSTVQPTLPARSDAPTTATDLGLKIGASDPRGEDVVERPCSPQDFLATIYHHLGIKWDQVAIKDLNGRPTPIVGNGRPIGELWG